MERLREDASIVRNGGGFSNLLWGFVDGQPRVNRLRSIRQVPAETELSRQISKDLARRGFKYCGPTIVYAFMQAAGLADDHLVSCFRR